MPMLTKKQIDAVRDEKFNSLQVSLASLNMFKAQIRLARTELVRGKEVDLSFAIGDKTIYSVITSHSVGADDFLELLYVYVHSQISQTVKAIAEMRRQWPDLPRDTTTYPVVVSLNPFQIVVQKRRKRGLQAIFAAIADLPIWLLTGKRPG